MLRLKCESLLNLCLYTVCLSSAHVFKFCIKMIKKGTFEIELKFTDFITKTNTNHSKQFRIVSIDYYLVNTVSCFILKIDLYKLSSIFQVPKRGMLCNQPGSSVYLW